MPPTDDAAVPAPKVVPKNEHIFPATEITRLANIWKELTAANKHDEALEVLEEIIKGSTPMFERLAQYEGFHHAVDLDTLVQSAREKVVKWLTNWNAKHGKDGRIFTWFSICVAGHTRVVLADGSLRRIDTIVDGKQKVEVMSWNGTALVPAKVVDWHRNPAIKSEWRRFSATHPSGFNRSFFVTLDHPILTQRGWVEVQDLASEDVSFLKTKRLTTAGQSAIIGMYLGDGHLRKDNLFTVGHTVKQKDYSQHIADKFGKPMYENWAWDGPRYRAVFSSTLPLLSVWWECRDNLKQKKTVDEWLIDRLNPIALAYWYMDDGSRNPHGKVLAGPVTLHTESFTPKQTKTLIGALETKFGIKSKFVPRRGKGYEGKDYGFIMLDRDSHGTFFSLIARYIIPNLAYKLPEKYRAVTLETPEFVVDTVVPCKFKVSPVIGRANVVKRSDHPKGWFTPDFGWKYDIEVEGTSNFLAEDTVVHNCAKHAFLSELAKTNQFKKRFHVTSDNLEKFYGAEDHELHKDDAADDVKEKLKQITVRWGDPIYAGAILYAVEAMIEERPKDKAAIIRGMCYAYGLSPEMGKFFYNWALFAMRDALHEKIHIPFTREDLFRHRYTFTPLVDLLTIISWAQFERLIAAMGGTRLKIPTLAQLNRLHQDYLTHKKIDKSDLDPESIAAIAKEEGRTPKNAADVYEEMTHTLNPDLSGEHELYE